MEFVEKMPNWLRYIIAVPTGILTLVIFYYIGYFSNLYIASPDSLFMIIYSFLYNNGINVFEMIETMKFVLPRHQFKFTLIISIIFCSLGMIGLGMSFITNNITLSYIIGLVLTFVCFIVECCHTYKTNPNS